MAASTPGPSDGPPGIAEDPVGAAGNAAATGLDMATDVAAGAADFGLSVASAAVNGAISGVQFAAGVGVDVATGVADAVAGALPALWVML